MRHSITSLAARLTVAATSVAQTTGPASAALLMERAGFGESRDEMQALANFGNGRVRSLHHAFCEANDFE